MEQQIQDGFKGHSPFGQRLDNGSGRFDTRPHIGRRLLRQLDRRAPGVLALNQLAVMGVLIGYSVWSIHGVLAEPGPYADAMAREPAVAEMLGDVEQLVQTVSVLVYVAVIFFAIIFQGGTACFYHTRRRHLEAYLARTPAWVIDVQRTSAGAAYRRAG